MRVYLHIGPYKTGTSHLQRFFALNAAPLLANGIYYPHDERVISNDELVSGNGFNIAMTARKDPKGARKLLEESIGPRQHHSVLFSSEFFCSLPIDHLSVLAHDAAIVFYIRSPVDLIISSVIQWVKRKAGTRHPKQAIESSIGRLKKAYPASDLKARLAEVERVSDTLIVRTYGDFEGGGIEQDFMRAIGVRHLEGFSLEQRITNRSLSEEEMVALLSVNRKHGDLHLSKKLSDAMMAAPLDTPVTIPRDLADRAAEEFKDDLSYISDRYGINAPPAYTDRYILE